jgi:hypothetical protein
MSYWFDESISDPSRQGKKMFHDRNSLTFGHLDQTTKMNTMRREQSKPKVSDGLAAVLRTKAMNEYYEDVRREDVKVKHLHSVSQWNEKIEKQKPLHLERNKRNELTHSINTLSAAINIDRKLKLKSLYEAEFVQYRKELNAKGLDIHIDY